MDPATAVAPASGLQQPSMATKLDTVCSQASLPGVSGKGHMGPNGYIPENDAYWHELTEEVDGRRQGRDPMAIPAEILSVSGHPVRRTSRLVSALGDVPLVDGLRRYRDLRRQCLDCADGEADVRRCAAIDCPLWPYRLGKNPHNPRRGKDPFAGRL